MNLYKIPFEQTKIISSSNFEILYPDENYSPYPHPYFKKDCTYEIYLGWILKDDNYFYNNLYEGYIKLKAGSSTINRYNGHSLLKANKTVWIFVRRYERKDISSMLYDIEFINSSHHILEIEKDLYITK